MVLHTFVSLFINHNYIGNRDKVNWDIIMLWTELLTALIYGYSIRSSVGMSNIRRIIGVCPQVKYVWVWMRTHLFVQILSFFMFVCACLFTGSFLLQFDILWDALSGAEHLHLFASIKGLPPDSIDLVCVIAYLTWKDVVIMLSFKWLFEGQLCFDQFLCLRLFVLLSSAGCWGIISKGKTHWGS